VIRLLKSATPWPMRCLNYGYLPNRRGRAPPPVDRYQISDYAAWRQRHKGVNYLPKVVSTQSPLLCLCRKGGVLSDTAIRPSVCPSCRRAAALGYRHAGCLQLSHVWTEDSTELPSAGAYRLAAPGAITCYTICCVQQFESLQLFVSSRTGDLLIARPTPYCRPTTR